MPREISLTQGKAVLVDDEDYDRLVAYRWQYCASGTTGYAKRTVRHGAAFETIRMHRIIMNVSPDLEVDHRNGNGLDNRRENLRVCSRAFNAKNRRPNKRSEVSYKGVNINKRTGKYTARLRKNGVPIHLGTFATPEAAAAAYDREALRQNGEFACLNFKAITHKE